MEAEHSRQATNSTHRIGEEFQRQDEAIAMGAMYIANHMRVKAVAALTESGSTARWMSRISSSIPIYALTTHQETCRRVSIYRGVYPVFINRESLINLKEVNRISVEHMVTEGIVKEDDMVIVTKGDLMGTHGGTNMLKIIRVGDHNNDQTY